MNTQYKSANYVTNVTQKSYKRKVIKRIAFSIITVVTLMNTAISPANACNEVFGVIFMGECNSMFYANSQFNMLSTRSQNLLNNFHMFNPNIYNLTNPGQSNLSQIINVYKPFLSIGSNFAQSQQANAFGFINNTHNRFDSGVLPYLNAAGLNSMGLQF